MVSDSTDGSLRIGIDNRNTSINRILFKMNTFSNYLLNKLLLRPIYSILLPCILLLFISFPSLYNFYLSPHSFINSLNFNSSNNLKSIRFTKLNNDLSLNLSHISIQSFAIYSDDNLLTKDSLIQFHDIQQMLFEKILENQLKIYSPLDYWNNDKNLILNDDNILKTIQLNGWNLKNSIINPLSNVKLFSGVEKLDGLIKSANILRIITLFNDNDNDDNIISILNENVLKINNSFNNSLEIQSSLLSSSSSSSFDYYKIDTKSYNIIEFILISIILPILFIQLVIKFKKLKLIKSKLGVLAGFIFQLTLTFFASLSLTSIWDLNLEFLQIPFLLIISGPLLISIENISRLIITTQSYSNEISFTKRVQKVVNNSFPISSSYNAFSILILLISLFMSRTNSSFYFCLFTIFNIILNYCLTYTYFFTILIVDLNKVELQDLIQISDKKNFSLPENNDYNQIDEFKIIINKEKSILEYLSLSNILLNLILFLIIITISLKWTDGIFCSDPNINLDLFLNKRGFVHELLQLSLIKENSLILKLFDPFIFSQGNSIINENILYENTIKYSFDLYYILESLFFILFTSSILMLILVLKINKSSNITKNSSINNSTISNKSSQNPLIPTFESKELVNGHVLDIVRLSTSACPFIVSVGIDHKILVWSPMKNPIPKPTQLPINENFLPITNVVMSDSGSFIAVYSKFGEIKCWSRLSMSWVWDVQIDELNNDIPLESFFRRRTHVSNGRRKLVSRSSKLSKTVKEESKSEDTNTVIKPKLKSRLKPVDENNLRPSRSLSLDSNFMDSVNLKKLTYNSDMEFIIVLKNGTIISIDCTNGEINKTILSNSALICAKKLLSPRVNDRIVCIKESGGLIVSTAVNNKWKSRPVKIDVNNYNMGKSLITPADLSKYNYSTPSSPTISPTNASIAINSLDLNNSINVTKKVDFDEDSMSDFKGLVMETVPFVGMIVRAFGIKCQLIDVQTGIVLKEWEIVKFKNNSFKVFHPEPSHCRFCGCASVSSFSVAYTELDTNYLILHTFSIDNRAKNNICLRVERDSRETRCLGFASVTEHRHLLSDVENWCSNDLNILMGIRRKQNKDDESIITSDEIINNDNNDKNEINEGTNTALNRIFESNQIGLRKRHNKINQSNELSSDILSKIDINNKINNTTEDFVITDEKLLNNDNDKMNKVHKISDIWGGWTMSAEGKVKFFEIPDGTDSGLLIKKIGPVCKFGHKSMIVSFGNIMKVLYLGNDNLIEEGDNEENEKCRSRSSSNASISSSTNRSTNRSSSLSSSSNASLDNSSVYQSSNSLSFINHRRKLRMKKYDLTYSTNFNDLKVIEDEE